jgi:serine/threonine protein kinase/Tol biopolymer transport system component
LVLTANTRLGGYTILSLIGQGGMGEVYRATDTTLKRQVAIKVLPESLAADADRLARFQREAEVLATLNHPNVAHIYGVERSTGTFALVMELVEGPTLAGRIAQGPIPIDEALPIAKQIADALEAAHEHGIIHRDLKPANIKVRDDGTVKVLDFGLAKLAESGVSASSTSHVLANSPTITSPVTMTGVGVLLGTAAYMSPEQAKGRPADRRSDLWAFGCVLFEMLTGTRAFPGDDLAEVLAAVIKSEPEWTRLPAATPAAIRRLLRRCLQKDAKRRLQTAGDARLEIDEALSEPDPLTPVAPTPAPRSRGRELVAWAVAGLALAGGATVTWLHLREASDIREPLHLSIALPEDSDVRSLAISPDGKSVVLAAQIDNHYQLWMRRLDRPELTPLAGTDRARVPFWSPDSRSVGFFGDGKLKTMSAAGGPIRVLCDSPNGGGGTWNQDGTILYVPAPLSAIFRVAAAGGACTPLTTPEPGSIHGFPEFLPDGRHFFYTVIRGDETKRGVYVESLDNPSGTRVLADQASVSYVPPADGHNSGHLIFLRGDTLMAQTFDAVARQVVGDPVAVASHAGLSNAPPKSAASTAPNGTLVFLANSEFSGLQLVSVDRSGKELETFGTPEELRDITVSPDGRMALVSVNSADRIPTLWLRDFTRRMNSRLSSPSGSSGGPAVWAPDSKRIVFGAVRLDSSVVDLYWKDIGSTDEHPLFKNSQSKWPSDWSRDGRYLVYTQVDPKTGPDIWVLPNPAGPAGTDQKPFAFANTPYLESQGQLSPDGRWMAYVSDESGQLEFWVRPFPTGDRKWRVSVAGGREPRWSLDGRELFYEDGYAPSRSRLVSVAVTQASVSGSPVSFGPPVPLFERRTTHIQPDGNWFSYAVLPGGRFLLHRFAATGRPTLDVLLNWQSTLRN